MNDQLHLSCEIDGAVREIVGPQAFAILAGDEVVSLLLQADLPQGKHLRITIEAVDELTALEAR